MKIYAQLNENKICIGISQLSGEVIKDDLIEIPNADTNYLWKKFENNIWSTEKFEPIVNTPLNDFESVKNQIASINTDLQNFMDYIFTVLPE